MRNLLELTPLVRGWILKTVNQPQWFHFKVQMRPCRPPASTATETDDLAAAISTSRCADTEVAVTADHSGSIEMERPSVSAAPATATDTIVGGSHGTSDPASDIKCWMVILDALGHHTRHREEKRGDQSQQKSLQESKENLKTRDSLEVGKQISPLLLILS